MYDGNNGRVDFPNHLHKLMKRVPAGQNKGFKGADSLICPGIFKLLKHRLEQLRVLPKGRIFNQTVYSHPDLFYRFPGQHFFENP